MKFATFLSACQTAIGDVLDTPDEVITLVAAVQVCGFRSVVGTLWGMSDTIGATGAEEFYQYVSHNRDGRFQGLSKSPASSDTEDDKIKEFSFEAMCQSCPLWYINKYSDCLLLGQHNSLIIYLPLLTF